MKKTSLTTVLLIAGFFTGTVIFTSCGNNKKEEAQEQTEGEDHEHKNGDGHAKVVAFVCPMHPEETGKDGDLCSKCGMPLEDPAAADSTKVHDD